MSLKSFSVWSGIIYTKSYTAAKTQLFSFISTEALLFSQHGSFVAACVQQKKVFTCCGNGLKPLQFQSPTASVMPQQPIRSPCNLPQTELSEIHDLLSHTVSPVVLIETPAAAEPCSVLSHLLNLVSTQPKALDLNVKGCRE